MKDKPETVDAVNLQLGQENLPPRKKADEECKKRIPRRYHVHPQCGAKKSC